MTRSPSRIGAELLESFPGWAPGTFTRDIKWRLSKKVSRLTLEYGLFNGLATALVDIPWPESGIPSGIVTAHVGVPSSLLTLWIPDPKWGRRVHRRGSLVTAVAAALKAPLMEVPRISEDDRPYNVRFRSAGAAVEKLRDAGISNRLASKVHAELVNQIPCPGLCDTSLRVAKILSTVTFEDSIESGSSTIQAAHNASVGVTHFLSLIDLDPS